MWAAGFYKKIFSGSLLPSSGASTGDTGDGRLYSVGASFIVEAFP